VILGYHLCDSQVSKEKSKVTSFASWKDYPDSNDEKVVALMVESRKSDDIQLTTGLFDLLR